MNKEEARQIIEGMMLGDGGLALQHGRQNAYFHLTRPATIEFYDYLTEVAEALTVLGVKTPRNHIRLQKMTYKKRESSLYLRLWTLPSPILTEWHRKWIDPDNPKHRVVPADLRLTPLSAARWLEGDGSTSWRTEQSNLVQLTLASHQFGHSGNLKLQELLKRDLGIRVYIYQHKHQGEWGYHLKTNDIEQVTRFLDTVAPYISPPYNYKLKYPWPKGAERAAQE